MRFLRPTIRVIDDESIVAQHVDTILDREQEQQQKGLLLLGVYGCPANLSSLRERMRMCFM